MKPTYVCTARGCYFFITRYIVLQSGRAFEYAFYSSFTDDVCVYRFCYCYVVVQWTT
jgi:hypothetical protein